MKSTCLVVKSDVGGAFVDGRRHTGKKKTLQVSYRCSTRKNKHACKTMEIRREYIETFVLKTLADYVFDDSLITKLVKHYKSYQKTRSSDLIIKRDELRQKIVESEEGIKNRVNLIVKSGSEILAKKLSQIETEKNFRG
ncbi:hypothetical protein SDC9_136479 [bioreactor metagenome]|uniref:Recombinase zinc beta ribbon domain-containing protein n=1 Tax=bioreactor metagenome TaxID=1076179 RepID=A0A645DIR8_9ZZZZ